MASRRMYAHIPLPIKGLGMGPGSEECVAVIMEKSDYNTIREIVTECGKPYVTLADMLKFVKENHPQFKD